MMRFSSFFAKLIVMKPASRQSIIDWVASTWSKIKQHPDMVAKSFLVTGIASDLDRSEDDIIMNAEVQEEISAKWDNPQNVAIIFSLEQGVKKGEGLLSHLNSVRPSIKFTVEVEKEGSLPFLDALLQRKDDGNLDVTVYRKPTHTDRYLDFRSHHPSHVKRGLVRCLYDRARSITTRQEDLQKEEYKYDPCSC